LTGLRFIQGLTLTGLRFILPSKHESRLYQ
jgi:hypothetical protein